MFQRHGKDAAGFGLNYYLPRGGTGDMVRDGRLEMCQPLETLEPRLLLSGTISAQFIPVDNSSALTGYKTYDIQVTTGRDWFGSELLIELTGGSIYQDAAGSERAPNPNLLSAYPTLEFDSYLSANGHDLSQLGRASEIGGDVMQFDNTGIDIAWFDLADDDIGTFVIGRITISDDAAGTVGMGLYSDGVSKSWNTFAAGDLVNLTPAAARPPAPPEPDPPSAPVDFTARFVEVDNSSALNGYKTYDIRVTSPSDWTSAVMLLELSGGSLYQDPLGTMREPPAALFSDHPTLEFDSYVTTQGNEASIAGGAGDVGGKHLRFNQNTADISWFDVQKNDVGTFTIGRITLSDNAAGDLKLLLFNGDQERIYTRLSITGGTLPDKVYTPENKKPPKPDTAPDPITTTFVEVNDANVPAGYRTFDLKINTPTDWSGASLQIDLERGSFYQDPTGSALAPNPQTFAAFPSLQFDTYVTANGRMTTIGGQDEDTTGAGYAFDTDRIAVSWSGPATDDVGTLLLGRITLSEDAVGSMSLSVAGDRNEFNDRGSFTAGNLGRVKSTQTPAAAAAADFTGDGKADILWWNSQTGRNSIWEMNRTSFVDSIDLPVTTDTNWEAVGMADMTGDGMADILWRNKRNGRNRVTEMNGTEVRATTDIKRLRSRAWVVGGVADFTGDGQADILWRNTKNGRNSVWEMDGTTFREGVSLRSASNKTRQVAAVGDFTGDGLADILWHDRKSGSNYVWHMDGTTYISQIDIRSQPDNRWRPAGTLLGLWE
jgi:hypothetical protein